MSAITGPGSAFELLFDESTHDGTALPPEIQQIYGGDWHLPDSPIYTYVNFATSRDGRVSFDEPGVMSGGDVSGFNRHDQWLMGLLRARADAIMTGDTTMWLMLDHVWTAECIFPDDAPTFATLRTAERRKPYPVQVIVSLNGDLPWQAEVFDHTELTIVIATTRRGAAHARASGRSGDHIDILDLGEHSCDLAELSRILRQDYAVQTLLCEGGPRIYGSMLAAGQIDEEFVTLCPIIIGNRPDGRGRPSLVEGVAFTPDTAPHTRPISLRRAGDHLFLRSRSR